MILVEDDVAWPWGSFIKYMPTCSINRINLDALIFKLNLFINLKARIYYINWKVAVI